MSPSPEPAEAVLLPEDVAALKALLLAERATTASVGAARRRPRSASEISGS